MNHTCNKDQSESSKLVLDLLSQHQQFHQFLDKLALRTDDMSVIEALIDIRKVNIDCITKYTDLLSKKYNFLGLANDVKTVSVPALREDDMTLWNIHGQLARFVPLYSHAIRKNVLTKIHRMFVAHNYESIISMKEQLLHPVSEEALMERA